MVNTIMRKTCNLNKNNKKIEDPKIPDGCCCDIDAWGCISNIKPICNNFEDDEGICKNCEHDIGCHYPNMATKKIVKIGGC